MVTLQKVLRNGWIPLFPRFSHQLILVTSDEKIQKAEFPVGFLSHPVIIISFHPPACI